MAIQLGVGKPMQTPSDDGVSEGEWISCGEVASRIGAGDGSVRRWCVAAEEGKPLPSGRFKFLPGEHLKCRRAGRIRGGALEFEVFWPQPALERFAQEHVERSAVEAIPADRGWQMVSDGADRYALVIRVDQLTELRLLRPNGELIAISLERLRDVPGLDEGDDIGKPDSDPVPDPHDR